MKMSHLIFMQMAFIASLGNVDVQQCLVAQWLKMVNFNLPAAIRVARTSLTNVVIFLVH